MRRQFIAIITILILCNVSCDNEEENRHLTVSLNPDCTNVTTKVDCETMMLVYARAEGSTNTLHYLWDFTGIPSILIALTDKNASLSVDWERFQACSDRCISFTSDPEYVFGIAIKSIVVFNDTKDAGNYSDASVVDVVKLDPHDDLKWKKINLTESNGQFAKLEMSAFTDKNETFSLNFTAFGFPAHNEELPHLYHTPQSMQIDIVAKNVSSNFTRPRIAIEFLTVSSEKKHEGSFTMNRRRNLDDEFTPGIFDVYNLVSPKCSSNALGGFIQFRPVCYKSEIRTVSSSTESRNGNIQDITDETLTYRHTILYDYFSYSIHSHITEGINITLGMSGDGFYKNYISFSFLMGIGVPSSELLSPFVITFATIGLGLPLVVLLVGGTYVAVRRYRG